MRAEGTWTASVLGFAADHPTAPGHFPGDPIIPGALLLAECLRRVAPEDGVREIRAAKFLAPVRPGDTVTLRWRAARAGEIAFEARREDGALAFSGIFVLGAGTP